MGVFSLLRVLDLFNPCLILKVLGILKGLFQKSLKRVQGGALPLPDKQQFDQSFTNSAITP